MTMHIIIIWATTVSTWVEQGSRKERHILSMHKLAGFHAKKKLKEEKKQSNCAWAGLGEHLHTKNQQQEKQ